MDQNPFASPQCDWEPPPRPPAEPGPLSERELLASWIREWMAGEHDFGALCFSVGDDLPNRDPAVRFAVQELEAIESRDDAHSPAGWKRLRRVLLMLESGCEVIEHRQRRWMPSQVVALAAVAGLATVLLTSGVGVALWVAGGVGAAVAWAIVRLREPDEPVEPESPYESIVAPFRSIAQLRAAYAATPAFVSPRVMREAPEEGNTPDFGAAVALLLFAAVAPMMAALWLVCLAAPEVHSRYCITTPASEAAA
ncbi:MAG: hypothetical protein AAGJ46_10305 [Planctomycetota bacterium]